METLAYFQKGPSWVINRKFNWLEYRRITDGILSSWMNSVTPFGIGFNIIKSDAPCIILEFMFFPPFPQSNIKHSCFLENNMSTFEHMEQSSWGSDFFKIFRKQMSNEQKPCCLGNFGGLYYTAKWGFQYIYICHYKDPVIKPPV